MVRGSTIKEEGQIQNCRVVLIQDTPVIGTDMETEEGPLVIGDINNLTDTGWGTKGRPYPDTRPVTVLSHP